MCSSLRRRNKRNHHKSNTKKVLISRICEICTRLPCPHNSCPFHQPEPKQVMNTVGNRNSAHQLNHCSMHPRDPIIFFFVEVKIQDAVANGEIVRECTNRERLDEIILSKDITFQQQNQNKTKSRKKKQKKLTQDVTTFKQTSDQSQRFPAAARQTFRRGISSVPIPTFVRKNIS